MRKAQAMPITVDDAETDSLAHAVAALTGETVAAAIRNALAERLERERLKRGEAADLAARIREIGEHCASLPVIDPRSPDEILGYDENGMWR